MVTDAVARRFGRPALDPHDAICHMIWHMRTTLDLDDGLVDALMTRYPGVSRTEAIEQAIRAHLEADVVERLLAKAGSFDIEDVSGLLRDADRPA